MESVDSLPQYRSLARPGKLGSSGRALVFDVGGLASRETRESFTACVDARDCLSFEK